MFTSYFPDFLGHTWDDNVTPQKEVSVFCDDLNEGRLSEAHTFSLHPSRKKNCFANQTLNYLEIGFRGFLHSEKQQSKILLVAAKREETFCFCLTE